jgi:hypothetical protein
MMLGRARSSSTPRSYEGLKGRRRADRIDCSSGGSTLETAVAVTGVRAAARGRQGALDFPPSGHSRSTNSSGGAVSATAAKLRSRRRVASEPRWFRAGRSANALTFAGEGN